MLKWTSHFCIITFFVCVIVPIRCLLNVFVWFGCEFVGKMVKCLGAWRCHPFYEDKFPDFGKFLCVSDEFQCVSHTIWNGSFLFSSLLPSNHFQCSIRRGKKISNVMAYVCYVFFCLSFVNLLEIGAFVFNMIILNFITLMYI